MYTYININLKGSLPKAGFKHTKEASHDKRSSRQLHRHKHIYIYIYTPFYKKAGRRPVAFSFRVFVSPFRFACLCSSRVLISRCRFPRGRQWCVKLYISTRVFCCSDTSQSVFFRTLPSNELCTKVRLQGGTPAIFFSVIWRLVEVYVAPGLGASEWAGGMCSWATLGESPAPAHLLLASSGRWASRLRGWQAARRAACLSGWQALFQ